MADYLNIAGRVRTTASDGVAIEAQEVKDLNLNKSQQEVNSDVQTELGDRYTKEETYSKEQLDELITTPDVNYVSVVATDATTAVTDILPATGEANTIYRVGNWNGTQYDSTMYALYAWNGSAYVCLAVRSFVGEVYDISVNHPDGQGNPTQYADLTAALGTNGENIPADIRRGGMSINFIQSTDNNSLRYVQYRYMGTAIDGNPNPFLDTDNWSFCGDDVYTNNQEFIEIHNDSDDVVLYGVKADGDFHFGKGVPSQIQYELNTKVDKEENMSLMSADEHTKLNALPTNSELVSELNGKVDKVEGKGLSTNDYDDAAKEIVDANEYIENPEYIHAIVGNNGRVIEAITPDGKKEINLDLEVNGSIDMDGVKTSNVENKEYINMLQEGEGKVLGWVNKNGGVDFADIPNSIRADVNEVLRKEGLYPATAGPFYEGMSRSELVRVYNSKIDSYAELCRYNSVSLYELSDTDSDELLYWKINHNFREDVVWEGMSDKAFASQLNKYFNIPVYRFQDAKMGNPNIYEIGNINKVNKSRFANYYDREPEYVNMENYPTKSFLCMMDSTGVPPMSDGVLSSRWREVTRNNSYPAYDNTHTYYAPFSRGTEPSSLIVDDGKKIRLYSATGIFSETDNGVNWSSPTRLKDAENNNLVMPGHPSVNYVDGMFMLIGCTSNNIDEGALALYTSTDGISFTYRGKIKGTQCGTDNIGNGHTFKYLGNTYLFKDYDGTYYLYYEGWENNNNDHPGWEMCLMTCTDLFRDYGNDIIGNWTQCNENPIFPSLRQGAEGNLYNKPYTPGNPEIVKGEDNQPLKYNGKYYMYFHTGHIDNRIERAYSYDLVHWTHEGSIIASRDVPDYGDNSDHCMCQFKGRSYLFYTVGINGSVIENGQSVYYRQDDLRYVIDDRPLIDMLKIKP